MAAPAKTDVQRRVEARLAKILGRQVKAMTHNAPPRTYTELLKRIVSKMRRTGDGEPLTLAACKNRRKKP
jgi:hypothetical protein